MKKINIILAALAALAFFASCEKPQPDGPDTPEITVTFPALVEDYEVSPGEKLALTFTPSKDWTIAVPSDNLQWFWIADGTFKLDQRSGKASTEPVTVNIGVSETEEFDMNRSCDVTLTIGEESKVIAKYMRPAKERTLALYMAELDDAGEFKLDEDGVSYVYSTAEAASVTLAWSASDADFRAPLRVESNGEWTVTYPEWLTVNVPEKTTGVTEIILTGSSLEEVSGKIAFKAGDRVMKEVDVTLPSCKGLDVRTAVYEDEEFKFADEGGYLWTEDAVEEFSLVWLGSDFRMPVSISSRCEWTISLPEWLSAELPEKTAGNVSFTIMGVPSKYPLEDTADKIVFKYEDAVIHEVKVTIPGCKDIMSYSLGMALTALDFNAVGEVMTSTGYADVDVTATLFGTSEVSVAAFEMAGGKYVTDKAPEWMTITVSNFNTADGASVLQEREVMISVSENNSDERSAVLLFVPHSMSGKAASFITDDNTAVKEEYMKYAVAVSQLSDKFTISMTSSEEAMAEAGASFVEASAEKKAELVAAFGETDNVYVLTYDNIYALDAARMMMSREFADVKVFDNTKADQSAVADFWLAFNYDAEAKSSGVVEMYFNSDPAALPPLPSAPSTGYVVFYDSTGAVLAIVECVSPWKEEEIVTPPGDEDGGVDDGKIRDEYGNVYVEAPSYFSDPEAAAQSGAKIYELESGPYYDQYSEYQCPILLLEYTSVDASPQIVLSSKVSQWFAYLSTYSEYVTVNKKTYANTSGMMSSTNKITIRMKEGLYEKRDEINAGNLPGFKLAFHKNMTTQDPTIVIFCRLTLE